MAISVNGTIPGGRIEVVDATRPDDIQLRFVPDPHCAFMGRFNFRITGARGVALSLIHI